MEDDLSCSYGHLQRALTTGHTLSSNLKATITGWEDLEVAPASSAVALAEADSTGGEKGDEEDVA